MANNTTLKPFPEIPLTKLIGISVGVFSSIGIIANGLVIAVLSISQRRRFSPYRYLITHLTLADLICALFLLAYVPVELNHHHWIYAKPACKIIYPCITFCTNLAIGTTLIIAVERYRGVIFPFSKAWRPRNVWLALTIVWIVSAITILPNIIVITVTKYHNIEYCNEKWENKQLQKLYGITFIIVAFFIPLLAIGYMNLHIVIRLKHRDLQAVSNSRWQQSRDKRIMRVLSAIVICFFICILPNKLLYFVWDVAPQLETDSMAKIRLYLRTIQVLFYARVSIDPLLYCVFDTRFKKDFKNSAKLLKGLSFIDSDGSTHRRSKSIMSKHFVSTNYESRSRTSTCLSNDINLYDQNNQKTLKQVSHNKSTDIIPFNKDLQSKQRTLCDSEENSREQPDSHFIELISCSTSPLVEPSYLNGIDYALRKIENTKTSFQKNVEHTNSESSSESTELQSVYGSATPLVGEKESSE